MSLPCKSLIQGNPRYSTSDFIGMVVPSSFNLGQVLIRVVKTTCTDLLWFNVILQILYQLFSLSRCSWTLLVEISGSSSDDNIATSSANAAMVALCDSGISTV